VPTEVNFSTWGGGSDIRRLNSLVREFCACRAGQSGSVGHPIDERRFKNGSMMTRPLRRADRHPRQNIGLLFKASTHTRQGFCRAGVSMRKLLRRIEAIEQQLAGIMSPMGPESIGRAAIGRLSLEQLNLI
jgi:hypothetical protein